MTNMMDKINVLGTESAMNPDDQLEDMEPLAMAPTYEPTLNATAATAPRPLPAWKKPPTMKPKRPLSAYNIFFQHEREKIVSNTPDTKVTLESLKIDPKRRPKKRRHRKSHGKIGFADLARTIAEKWKTLDSESRSVFEACARKEKQRYQEEMKEWKNVKKMEALEEEEAKLNSSHMDMAAYLARHTQRDNMALARAGAATQPSQMRGGLRPNDLFARNMAAPDMNNNRILQAQAEAQARQSQGEGDIRDYLRITQQVIDMARASLTLPLFSGAESANRMNQASHLGDLSAAAALRMGANQHPGGLGDLGTLGGPLQMNNNQGLDSLSAALRMSANQPSGLMEPMQQLPNMQFGHGGMSDFDMANQGFQNQLLQQQHQASLDAEIHGLQNQAMRSLRAELDSQNLQALQANQQTLLQSDLDYSLQDHSVFDPNPLPERRHGDKGQPHQLQQNRPTDADDLVSMLNASLRDNF